MVTNCLSQEKLENKDVIIIENVGNLVCPSYYSLGEDIRVVVLSVTEGEDKPIKYPKIFNVADVVIINKVDLVPHLGTDMKAIYDNIKQVAPKSEIIEFSFKEGKGVDKWYEYLNKRLKQKIGSK